VLFLILLLNEILLYALYAGLQMGDNNLYKNNMRSI